MTAILRGNALNLLKHLASTRDMKAVGVMAILQGTEWVDLTAAAEASNSRLVTFQVRQQDGDPVKAVRDVVVEAFNDGGLFLTPVRLATAAALPACTAAGTGVGKTLTGNTNAALTVDGVVVALNDRILVKNQGNADNGIYKVTQLGDGASVPSVLTRATDWDQSTELKEGQQWAVTAGTANGGHTFVFTTAAPVTIDVTTLTFADLTTFTAADLAGLTAGGTGTLKVGSATSKVWIQSNSSGVFSLSVKNVLIGNVLLKITTDNGEQEQTLVAFA